jgi:hypothetical protein
MCSMHGVKLVNAFAYTNNFFFTLLKMSLIICNLVDFHFPLQWAKFFFIVSTSTLFIRYMCGDLYCAAGRTVHL